MTATTPTQHQARARALAEKLIEFLQTSEVPDGLFGAGMFCDFTMPTWRLQASGVEDSVALRLAGHPGGGRRRGGGSIRRRPGSSSKSRRPGTGAAST